VIEEELGERLRAGDFEGAATLTLRHYGPQLLSYLCLVLRSEDAGHEVFAQFSEDLWRGIRAFRQECSVKTWSYKIAWHAAQRYARDAYRRRVRRLETRELSKIVADVRSSTLGYARAEVNDRLARIRESLDPVEQSLLTLRVDRDFSWREVAEVLSTAEEPVDEAALRKRFERLRKKLRDLATEQGL
jgi:RNA polymerase sigma-70 factor (ECF subfamily)